VKTWVIAPVYRDVESFLLLRERVREVLERDGADPGAIRFVVLDDTAGQDPQIATVRACEDVTVLQPPFNLGHQRAIVYALRKTLPKIGDDDTVITLDSDGEDRPEDLPRMLAPLAERPSEDQRIVLALRTKRHEPLLFKLMYRLFRLLFRALTGTTVQTGNFATMPGAVAKRVVLHPTFDLAYSSTILALDLPIEYVPCERGERYAGKSKMTYGKLAMHGVRMLMPFTDRIAIRALFLFAATLALGIGLAAAMAVVALFGSAGAPAWVAYAGIGAAVVSLVALANFVTLFVLFSQTRAVSLASIEELSADLREAEGGAGEPGGAA
jgi:hypothetical protein